MASYNDLMQLRLSPAASLAVDAWIDKREQDAELTTSDIEDLLRVLGPGTPVMLWNGEDYVPLRADMLSVGERSGKIYLGGP